MTRIACARTVCRALFELARYDIAYARRGFHSIVGPPPEPPAGSGAAVDVKEVCDAVLLAVCLYWKRVQCLQRSTCTARVLRSRGVQARLVIGYRAVPFFSHAWVEVDGRIVNDSAGYQRQLQVLCTF